MSISSVNGVASTVSRYRFVAAGGETSLSGTDANGATLSYLIGKEEVYLNGVLLVRGQDYTGTDGATISSLTALVAGDTVEIITFVPFAIPTAISSSTVTTAGDLIVATGASAVTRLGVGSSGTILTSNGTTPAYTSTITGTLNNGTLTGTLTAASTSGTSGQYLQTTGSGVQWATPASGSITLLSTTTLSGASTTISGIDQSYSHLYCVWQGVSGATNFSKLYADPNGTSNIAYLAGVALLGTTSTPYTFTGDHFYVGGYGDGLYQNNTSNWGSFFIYNYSSTTITSKSCQVYTRGQSGSVQNPANIGGNLATGATAISSLVFSGVGTMSAGTVYLYGVK